METPEIMSTLEEVLELDAGELEKKDLLEDIGWDSLTFMSFLTLLDERHSLKIAPNEIAACQTVDQLIQLLINK